ncbi:MAG: FAD-dependent oxidoreductase [Lachnospiraceae bacterium]|nr:FAD-dependent oxidoreductase [Lachnospiraceae bacterium]
MNKFPHLFSPLKVNNKYTFKNRIESAPMAFGLIACDPHADQSFRKLESIARGGDACVAVGEIDVNFRDAYRIPLPHVDFTDTEGYACQRVGEYARRIHKHDAIAICELCHPGREKVPFGPDEEAIGPNDEINPLTDVHVRAMNEDDMKRIANDFVIGCKFLQAAGYDGVIIHGGHGFLFTQFLSPLLNKRTDEYGGSLENRAKFPIMILKAMRDAMGPDFIIEFRVSADDTYDGGITPEETGQFAHMLEGIVDLFQVSTGIYYDAIVTHQFSSMYVPHGCNSALSKIVKQYTNIPVGVVGGINSPEQMEEIIAKGEADYIVLGRQSLADPELANKAKAGEPERVRRCLRCFKCFPGSPEEGYTDIPFKSEELARHVGYCTINPLANLEFDHYELEPPKELKKVLIVGGGVAGMEAAIRAFDRGHKVILAEKDGFLGGMLFFTDVDIDKPDLRNFKNMLINEVKIRDIDVRLNTTVDKAFIDEVKPDHIIIATGAQPACPPIPGIENAFQSLEAYRGNVVPGKRVVMVGGGLIGSEQGLFLAKTGHEVTVVEMLPRVANEAYGMYREALVREMAKENMTLLENTKCLEIGKDFVKVQLPDGTEKTIECDTVLHALGMKSVPTKELEEAAGDIPFTVIGDAIAPGKVDQATKTGYMAAIEIGK